MHKMIRKSILLILIAIMLTAPSMSLMQAYAQARGPQPSGEFYLYPSVNNVYFFSSPEAPTSGGVEPDLSGSQSLSLDGFTGYQIYTLPNIVTPYWYIFYTGYPPISGQVEVFVQYDPTGLSLCQQKHLRLCIYDPVDLNLDGTVTIQDVAIMLKAIQCGSSDQRYDLNHDGVVNCADLQIVLQFLIHGLVICQGGHLVRLPWMDITAGVDTTHHYVYGFTGHFSVFGVH